MANHIALQRGLLSSTHYKRMKEILRNNYLCYKKTTISFEAFFAALMKDKKNTSTHLALILPTGKAAKIERGMIIPDESFRFQGQKFLLEISE